jgi:hypothetical protein
MRGVVHGRRDGRNVRRRDRNGPWRRGRRPHRGRDGRRRRRNRRIHREGAADFLRGRADCGCAEGEERQANELS